MARATSQGRAMTGGGGHDHDGRRGFGAEGRFSGGGHSGGGRTHGREWFPVIDNGSGGTRGRGRGWLRLGFRVRRGGRTSRDS